MYKKVTTTEEYYDEIPLKSSHVGNVYNAIHIYPNAMLTLLEWVRNDTNNSSNTSLITDNMFTLSANKHVITLEELPQVVSNTTPMMAEKAI